MAAGRPPTEDDPERWFVEAGDLLAQAYCVTLVQGVAVAEAFARLDADTAGSSVLGLDDLVEAAYEGHSGGEDRQLVGACVVGGWTLLLEPNGFAGTDVERQRRLSTGTTAITLYLNVNSHSAFVVTVGGRRLLGFDMLFPAEREGERRDDFVVDMTAAGFAVEETDEEDDAVGYEVAGAALVERLAGVRLTVGLLDSGRYVTALLEGQASVDR